jgi:putative peptide zinc metalloprotease protein
MNKPPMLSTNWFRVAALKPRLRPGARLHRHRYRGQVWYLLQDTAMGRVHRFNAAARQVIAGMDGRHTVEALWNLALARLGEDAPTQDEMIQMLGQLHASDLLQADVTPDVAELFDRGQRARRSRLWRSVANPMSIRIPIWDPDAFLNRFPKSICLLWSGWGALLWLAVVGPALLLLPPHWNDLTHNFGDRVLQVDNLLSLWIVFPLVKICHEMGHAAATKAGGGEVHDMGVMLLVLMPVPYVDASAATVFRSKHRRMLVGAAGMLVEVFIAALAFFVWLAVEAGTARALAFNVMVVAGVSTLVFNGNPLLRYDAYYMLADWIEMPNLAKRSLDHWAYLLQRYLLRLRDAEAPSATASEKTWFVLYGAASAVYRTMVTVAIALFIAGQFFFVGVILAIWALVAMAVVPLVKGMRFVFTSPLVQRRRRQTIAWVGLVGGVLVLALCLVPAPYRTQAEGVIWLSEQAAVRAGADGFCSELLVDDGQAVTVGTPLIQSVAPALDSQTRLAQANLAEQEARYATEVVSNRANADIAAQRVGDARAALNRAQERAEGLLARAGAYGVFRVPQAGDLIGRFHRKGVLLGYVVEPGQPVVRVVVAQADIGMAGAMTGSVEVRAAHEPERVLPGRLLRQVPAGADSLPSRVLALDGGGKVAVDPRDPSGTRTLERTFQLEIELPEPIAEGHFGERIFVRFDHPALPLAVQGYRSARRLLLRHFNV